MFEVSGKKHIVWCPLLQPYGASKAPHTESRVDWLCECCVDFMQKAKATTDVIKCQCSLCMIHIDTDSGSQLGWNVLALIVVHKEKFVSAIQTPGLVVPAHAALVALSFAADSPVGYGYVDLCSTPIHLPVTASPTHTLPAQDLSGNMEKHACSDDDAPPETWIIFGMLAPNHHYRLHLRQVFFKVKHPSEEQVSSKKKGKTKIYVSVKVQQLFNIILSVSVSRQIDSHLLPVVKSIWMVRVVLWFTFHRSSLVSLRQVKTGVNRVDIQSQLAGV